jgi:hypothetical protein
LQQHHDSIIERDRVEIEALRTRLNNQKAEIRELYITVGYQAVMYRAFLVKRPLLQIHDHRSTIFDRTTRHRLVTVIRLSTILLHSYRRHRLHRRCSHHRAIFFVDRLWLITFNQTHRLSCAHVSVHCFVQFDSLLFLFQLDLWHLLPIYSTPHVLPLVVVIGKIVIIDAGFFLLLQI